MSKKKHTNRNTNRNNNRNNNTNEKPLFNILTESKIQKRMQDQLTFTHGLMKAKKNQFPVSSQSPRLKKQLTLSLTEKRYLVAPLIYTTQL